MTSESSRTDNRRCPYFGGVCLFPVSTVIKGCANALMDLAICLYKAMGRTYLDLQNVMRVTCRIRRAASRRTAIDG